MENESDNESKLDPIDRLTAHAIGSASSTDRIAHKDTSLFAKEVANKNPKEFMDIARKSQLKQMQREGMISSDKE